MAEEIRRQVRTYQDDLKAKRINEDETPVTADSVRAEIDKDLKTLIEEELPESLDGSTDTFVRTWREADLAASVIYPKLPKPPASEESVARGRQLFLGKCAVCHGETAEGNGANTRAYQQDPINGGFFSEPGFFDAWGQPISPRNLNTGIYRGGRRPLDIYRRIHGGIPGTPMPASPTFKDGEIWDLVDYVMSIPIDGPVPKQTTKLSQMAKASKPDKPKLAQTENDSAKNAE